MKPGGQRQDVAYLSLAVAVLAVAVALFVGIRAFPRKPKQTAPTKIAAAPSAAKQLPSRLKAAGKRDPFASQAAKEAAAKGTSPEPLKLVGVVRGKQPLAVIRRGDRRYYAKLGDAVSGYTLVGIGVDQVTLIKGSERVTLPLHGGGPEPAGG
jgi:hypothetical protein